MLSLLIILVFPWLPVTQCNLKIRDFHHTELKPFYQDGDLIIGGLLTQATNADRVRNPVEYYNTIYCAEYGFEESIQPQVFIYAIYTINQNPDILPNITLGYNLYETCADEHLAIRYLLHIMSGPDKVIPNYSCTRGGQLAGLIGDQQSSTTIPAAQVLGLYGYPQVLYTLGIGTYLSSGFWRIGARGCRSSRSVIFITLSKKLLKILSASS